MKIKKLLSVLLIASVVTLSATACGTSTPTVSTSSMPSTVSQSSVNSTSSGITKYSDDNDTKVQQMMENITFDGKKLSFPFKASDLGSGYSFSDDVSVYENKYAITYLLHNGEKVTTVSLVQYDNNKNVNDCYADSISFSNTDDEKFLDILKIDGIGLGDNINNAINKFGEPTKIDEAKTCVYEMNNDNIINRIVILVDNNDLIENIGISIYND